MRRAAALISFALAARIAAAQGSLDTAVPPLRFDPFALPDLDAPAEGREEDDRASARGVWAPVLQAILIGGDASLVNLGGVVLRPGQETRGWRLVEVRAEEAIFLRDGQPVLLTLTQPIAGGAESR